jgi:hypothetical protein
VNLSEVITAIQDVTGVVGVLVTQLYRSTDAPALNQFLAAAIPQSGARAASITELLTLDPAPLSLVMEVAP